MKEEDRLILKLRSRKINVVKPSTLLFSLLCVFYLLSGIDLVPEAIVQPRILGYIDDVIVLIITIIIVYPDIGGLLGGKVQSLNVPKIQRIVEDSVSVGMQRDEDTDTVLPSTSDSPESIHDTKSDSGGDTTLDSSTSSVLDTIIRDTDAEVRSSASSILDEFKF
jgi:hypothetical protein